jgi:hypothetical protein
MGDFVYDDSGSPKRNLLRSQGQTADSWAGVLSPSDAHPDAQPDLNRLHMGEARWDAGLKRWVKR